MKRKTDNFSKFYNKKNNAAIKEAFRQEKKAAKRERKEAIERHFEEKRKARGYQAPQPGERPGERPAQRGERPTQRPTERTTGKQPIQPPTERAAGKPIKKAPAANASAAAKPPVAKPIPGNSGKATPFKPAPGKATPDAKQTPGAPAKATPGAKQAPGAHHGEQLPLNKYIAHGGVCSRRDAAELIRQGKVTVNGQLVTEPGTKVLPTDTVKFNGKKVTISRNFVYVLLNKPKDYITTTDDPQGRRTVLDLIRPATTERVFPVGRLDRNTSGVLLLTNDGDLAQKLAHPSHEIKKIYHVVLDKPLTKADFEKIIGGSIMLEDGPALVDVLAYADPKDKTQIGLEIHSGRNRIVRRIFEHLGYDVRGLDRVMYAGLTKKNVQRGKWRLLTEKEVRILKYLNSSFKGSLAPARTAAAAAASAATRTSGASDTAAASRTAAAGAAARTAAAAGKPANTPPTDGRPAKPASPSEDRPDRSARSFGASTPDKRPARAIPPKGRKSAAPPKGRKPYNPKSPRPESD
ncbi:MAG TPA: pseudouridine synthase [Puia sp.]|nr:pseudouridine synthase [Puia sp.]